MADRPAGAAPETSVVLQKPATRSDYRERFTEPLRWMARGALAFAALRLTAYTAIFLLTGGSWRPGPWASLSTLALVAVGGLTVWLLGRFPPGPTSFVWVAGGIEILIAYLVGASLVHWQRALTQSAVEGWLERGSEAPWSLGGGEVAWAGVWVLAFAIVVPLSPWRQLVTGGMALASLVFWPLLSVLLYPMPEGLEPYVAEVTSGLIASLVISASLCLLIGYVARRQLDTLSQRLESEREMGSYRLVELLGRGGMGEVWRAEHRLLARAAAIKLIRPQARDGAPIDTTLLLRFEREVQATSQLESPHTLRVFDFGFVGETFYYAMELLDGIDLQDLVERYGPQLPARVLHVWVQALDSLAEAHARSLVHRDVKPANVMLCRVGLEHDFVKVLDFGLVKSRSPQAGEQELTRKLAFAGTPAYAAPEVAQHGADQATASSDLYSLACVMYWMLTGRRVFEEATAMNMLAAHIGRDPTSPSEVIGSPVPAEMERLLMACLAKNPADRPGGAEELAARLRGMSIAAIWGETQARHWWRGHAGSDAEALVAGPGS